jgi:hypothetical protein
MGRALAELLTEHVPEAEQRHRAALADLLNADTTGLPPEADVRVLLEAAAAVDTVTLDVDAAITVARADGDLFEGDELPAESLQAASAVLLEAVSTDEAKGTRRYKSVVIRPGRAKGTGRRFYSPRMLEANAANFGGVTCFFNHEDLAKIMARGHGSRDPRDVCGWLQESTTWDPTYTEPDDAKHGRLPGAVMGHVDLLVEAADRVDALPQAFSLSVCMDPTSIRVGRTPSGELAPLVEGVVPKSGSLDLITGEAGAGGRLLERLRESAEARYGSANADLAEISDEMLVEAARARPGVLAELRREDPAPPPDPEDEDVDLTKLVEAVTSDPAAAEQLAEALAGTPTITRLVESAVADREDDIRADARAEGQRDLSLRDLRDDAHTLIEASSVARGGILTPAYTDYLRERYTIRDGVPSVALDVHDQLGADGAVVKSARERLLEAVAVDITTEQTKLRESAPTHLRGLGAPAPTGGDGGGDGNGGAPPVPPADPMSKRLDLDPAKVREFQGV